MPTRTAISNAPTIPPEMHPVVHRLSAGEKLTPPQIAARLTAEHGCVVSRHAVARLVRTLSRYDVARMQADGLLDSCRKEGRAALETLRQCDDEFDLVYEKLMTKLEREGALPKEHLRAISVLQQRMAACDRAVNRALKGEIDALRRRHVCEVHEASFGRQIAQATMAGEQHPHTVSTGTWVGRLRRAVAPMVLFWWLATAECRVENRLERPRAACLTGPGRSEPPLSRSAEIILRRGGAEPMLRSSGDRVLAPGRKSRPLEPPPTTEDRRGVPARRPSGAASRGLFDVFYTGSGPLDSDGGRTACSARGRPRHRRMTSC